MDKKIQMNGLVEAFFYLTLVAVITMMFSRVYWLLDLTSSFCIQYIFILFFAVIFFAVSKKKKPLIVFTIALLINLAYVMPYFIMPRDVEIEQTSKLRMVMFNVNNSNEKYKEVISYLKEGNFDALILLEVNYKLQRELKKLTKLYPYQKGVPRNDSFGIYLLSRKPTTMLEIFDIPTSQGVPATIAKIEHDGQHLTVLGVHTLPPVSPTYAATRNKQLQILANKVKKISTPIVVAGDFNVTPWSPYFSDFLLETSLRDTRKGYGVKATWPSTIPLLWIPIDHCFVSQNIQVHNYAISNNLGSDHYPIEITFSIPVTK